MAAALGRFFATVSVAVLLLLGSGLALLGLGGPGGTHWSVHAMAAIGLLMMAVYGHIRLSLYPRLRQAVAAQQWPQAAAALNAIRGRVGLNLLLGTGVFVLALVGPALPR
jgi:uncharacterized membrane protein